MSDFDDNTEVLDDEIAVIRGEIWDNCREYCRYCKIDIPENEESRVVKACPKCKRALGFIGKKGIDEYLKTLDPEEREAREKGLWKHLSGLVYKEFDRDLHTFDDFMIPKRWMKIESVDPHDARATHWMFGAVSPEEIEIFGKKRHRIYFFDCLLLKGTIDEMARSVKSLRQLHGYDDPRWVVLDRKFGEKTQMEDKSWQSELERAGIKRILLSHSAPGDVELGHKVVREYLKPQYSALTGAAKPGVMFAKKACGGKGRPIHYMSNYQYKEDSDKPVEQYKDWPDTVRYACMEQPIYVGPEEEAAIAAVMQERMEKAYSTRRGLNA